MTFTQAQKSAFDRDGYLLISGLFEPAQIEAARKKVEELTYGKSFSTYLADREQGVPGVAAAGRSQFPTGFPELDSFLENEHYLDCIAGCLGSDQMSYCNGHLFVRSGPDDSRHSPEPWQGYHFDDTTCSFLPPHRDVPRYAYVNSWVALDDIEADSAPLQVIPGSHLQLEPLLPDLTKSGAAQHGNFRDIREISAFAKPIPVLARAGDVLLYSSYLVHGAVGFSNKKKQRPLWTMSLARAENAGFTRLNHLYQMAEREFSVPFWTNTTPRVRSLFGWPPPGDAYYTPETLELLAAWYPGMNLQPYGRTWTQSAA